MGGLRRDLIIFLASPDGRESYRNVGMLNVRCLSLRSSRHSTDKKNKKRNDFYSTVDRTIHSPRDQSLPCVIPSP
jgi:hypothetical protein